MELCEVVGTLGNFLSSVADHLWLVDARVLCDGALEACRNDFNDCPADFLATDVRTYAEEPEWHRWPSLTSGNEEEPLAHGVAALLPLVRMSRKAAEAILLGIEAGWAGDLEALIPTLVNRAKLKIEDIGGSGSFTPPDQLERWYDRRTWHWQGPVEYIPGMLHFPAPLQRHPLAKDRIKASRGKTRPKILYAAPVGAHAAELLPEMLAVFLDAGADCLLLQYDEAELQVPEAVRVIRDKGYKFPLAIRHLHPDSVREYDFIFYWDDDVEAENFDPYRFVKIMEMNRLDMAQPAIQSPHGISHAITQQRPCPPPWRDPFGEMTYSVVGRLTNFVEIMAPVFTRKGWREFFGYLDPGNRSGWGYDYIPMGRKGIVDALPVVHTRAVRSVNGTSAREIRQFLDSQGLFRHQPVEHGWLFEKI